MRARLERAEVPPEEVEAAVAELTALGYLDDARFSRLFAEDKRALEDWGGERIERALLSRGIDRRLAAETARGSTADAPSDLERALALLHKRFPRPPQDLRDRERALGVLLRKGYDSDLAYDAIRSWAHAPGAREAT